MSSPLSLTTHSAWQDLIQHAKTLQNTHLKDLFKADPERFEQFSIEGAGLLLDYSKQRIVPKTIQILCTLAEQADLLGFRDQLERGGILNTTENRTVVHPQLRAFQNTKLTTSAKVRDERTHRQQLEKLKEWAEQLDPTIEDIVSLGIGGSDLGPRMIDDALHNIQISTHVPKRNLHFVSNMDGHTLQQLFKTLNPKKTLCIINSKTFTTPETLINATVFKDWFLKHSFSSMNHLVGVTAYPDRAKAFGISEDNIFQFEEGVGGRFSVWSPVGLSIILKYGIHVFQDFLAGAEAMDKHFFETPFEHNMPVIMALLGIWNINIWQYKTLAVIPYQDGLSLFPAYLQQLEMESNGKMWNKQGKLVGHDTAPVIWGGVGCDGQHAYMQLLHQGPNIIPVDFLVAAKGHAKFPEHQEFLIASCLAQSKALMEGSNENDATQSYKNCPGDRPSNTLVYDHLSPQTLGALIALYEHKVFVQGIIWGINSFDQWGVELGKTLVKQLLANKLTLDSSTSGLLAHMEKLKG